MKTESTHTNSNSPANFIDSTNPISNAARPKRQLAQISIDPTNMSDATTSSLSRSMIIPLTPPMRVALHKSEKAKAETLNFSKHIPPNASWENIHPKKLFRIRAQIDDKEITEKSPYEFLTNPGRANTKGYTRQNPNTPMLTVCSDTNMRFHYSVSQNRQFSMRENLRFQSCPDDFVCSGKNKEIKTQIANLVPPVMSFQIAKGLTEHFGQTGAVIDLFCGIGGMGLGFKEAKWQTIVAADSWDRATECYAHNVDESVLTGDLSDESFLTELFKVARAQIEKLKKENSEIPIVVIGGPPCQGFTSVNRNNTKKEYQTDTRNFLYKCFLKVFTELKADAFVMENVVNMARGKNTEIYNSIMNDSRSVASHTEAHQVLTSQYGIPQRRERIFIVGTKTHKFNFPPPITNDVHGNQIKASCYPVINLKHPAVSAKAATEDLVRLEGCGVTASADNQYQSQPNNSYQQLMRRQITFQEYIDYFNQ